MSFSRLVISFEDLINTILAPDSCKYQSILEAIDCYSRPVSNRGNDDCRPGILTSILLITDNKYKDIADILRSEISKGSSVEKISIVLDIIIDNNKVILCSLSNFQPELFDLILTVNSILSSSFRNGDLYRMNTSMASVHPDSGLDVAKYVEELRGMGLFNYLLISDQYFIPDGFRDKSNITEEERLERVAVGVVNKIVGLYKWLGIKDAIRVILITLVKAKDWKKSHLQNLVRRAIENDQNFRNYFTSFTIIDTVGPPLGIFHARECFMNRIRFVFDTRVDDGSDPSWINTVEIHPFFFDYRPNKYSNNESLRLLFWLKMAYSLDLILKDEKSVNGFALVDHFRRVYRKEENSVEYKLLKERFRNITEKEVLDQCRVLQVYSAE